MKPKINIKKIMTKMKTTDFFVACKDARIENNTSFYGCFYIGPFDESLSQTLANDLRRTLLSELTGLAITSIEIEGVLHKFSSLPGMKESVLDLICNLQNIVLKKYNNTNNTKKTYTGFLNVTGPRVIKAIDLKLPAGLQCVDPNQYIATLAEDGFLNLKFNINEGKNFIKQKPNNLDVQGLKKRNILLFSQDRAKHDLMREHQDSSNLTKEFFGKQPGGIDPQYAKHEEQNQNTSKASAESALQTQYAEQKEFKIYNFNIKNKKENQEFLSNPIPLDAVFMPVTKINCIVEENNMYSDFSTDFQENSFNLKNLNKSIYIGADAVPLHQEDHKDLSDLLENYNVNNLGAYTPMNEIKSDFQSFFNLINYNSLFQTFYLKEKQLNNFKLIPWHANSLYFSFPKTRTDVLDPFNKINLFLTCKATSGLTLSNYAKHHNKSETNHKMDNLSMLNLKKKIIKLAFKTKEKETVNINTQKDITCSYFSKSKVRTQKQGNLFKINSTDNLIQNTMYLEYSKNLKIKPLRKKTHLIVEIWTNGSIHPRQALYQSFSFLSNVFLKLQTVKSFDSPYKNKIKTNYNYRPSNIGFKYSEYALHNKKHNQIHKKIAKDFLPFGWLAGRCYAEHGNENGLQFSIQLAKLYYLNKKIKLVKPSKTTIKTLTKQAPSGTKVAMGSINEETSRVFSNKNKVFKLLKTPISILPLSLRTYTALKKENILTLNELIKKSKKDLLKIKNIGIKSLGEIETSLYCLGLALKI